MPPADLTETIARRLTKADLEAPLDPALDYYDATPTIEETLKLVKELEAKVDQLERFIGAQLQINQKILAQLADLTSKRTSPPSKLIGIH